MSPEYKRWKDVPKDFRTEIGGFVDESDFNIGNLINRGFYFLRNSCKESITKIVPFPGRENEINENQKKQALKEKSNWFLIRGIKGSSRKKKFCDLYDCSELTKGSRKVYRGKHRSHTKGSRLRRNLPLK